MGQVTKVHYQGEYSFTPCGLSKGSGVRSEDPAHVTCLICLRSSYGPNGEDQRARREAMWEAARDRAKDRREAEQVVLARHQGELEAELVLRVLARMGVGRR